MTTSRSKPNITAAASKLRSIIWAAEEGELLGSEDDITNMLEVSRPTVRQVARLLEVEGLLKVRRGINGGYFATRPSIEVIEASVSSYLQMVVGDEEDVTEIASVMWAIIVRKAAALQSPEKKQLMEGLRSKVLSLKDNALFDDLLEVEDETRAVVFNLVNNRYIELIFHINRVFASKHFPFNPADRDNTPEHYEYVKAWRKAKLLELDAIAEGNCEVAELAARFSRSLFHRRLYGHKHR